jgi:hypothetical protein
MANNHTVSIEIRGTLVGTIWWPVGAECWKDARHDVTGHAARCINGDAAKGKPSLRQHVDAMVNDGDFQGAEIADGELIITIRKPGRSRSRSFPLTMFPSIADMRRDDWEGPYCDCDDE